MNDFYNNSEIYHQTSKFFPINDLAPSNIMTNTINLNELSEDSLIIDDYFNLNISWKNPENKSIIKEKFKTLTTEKMGLSTKINNNGINSSKITIINNDIKINLESFYYNSFYNINRNENSILQKSPANEIYSEDKKNQDNVEFELTQQSISNDKKAIKKVYSLKKIF